MQHLSLTMLRDYVVALDCVGPGSQWWGLAMDLQSAGATVGGVVESVD